ncbi:KEOPS complex subunit Pcc1 [Thermococcus sp. 4557]|uniref:KEOPS complex subunit Pcc1 n=1 Tax=Thermococcus sp. (strain CGMCC 1.5172 / 4557) TaxID=1042877 RepID=UPI00064F98ED|nr:KEOPS complex subunit Pcc1 [Thermococcus sp. 4557]
MGLQGSDSEAWPIEGVIELSLPDEETAKIVYESVLYEHESVPYRRSRIEFLREGNRVIIRFLARDNSALRGTLNSYLRWIKVAIDAIEP